MVKDSMDDCESESDDGDSVSESVWWRYMDFYCVIEQLVWHLDLGLETFCMDFWISGGFHKDLKQTLLVHKGCVGHNLETCANWLGWMGNVFFCC